MINQRILSLKQGRSYRSCPIILKNNIYRKLKTVDRVAIRETHKNGACNLLRPFCSNLRRPLKCPSLCLLSLDVQNRSLNYIFSLFISPLFDSINLAHNNLPSNHAFFCGGGEGGGSQRGGGSCLQPLISSCPRSAL